MTKVEKWDDRLSVLDVDRFYGSDIQGIWDKLDLSSESEGGGPLPESGVRVSVEP